MPIVNEKDVPIFDHTPVWLGGILFTVTVEVCEYDVKNHHFLHAFKVCFRHNDIQQFVVDTPKGGRGLYHFGIDYVWGDNRWNVVEHSFYYDDDNVLHHVDMHQTFHSQFAEFLGMYPNWKETFMASAVLYYAQLEESRIKHMQAMMEMQQQKLQETVKKVIAPLTGQAAARLLHNYRANAWEIK